MKHGLKMPGNTQARRTIGPAWRWMKHAASSSFPPALPLPISTARIASATTCLPIPCWPLNAETGQRIWHFQAVKHDLWDRDFPSPPTLVTVKRNGKSIDAVAQATKQGWLYLFDRTTASRCFPSIQKISGEHRARRSDVGNAAAATKPAPLPVSC